MCRGRWVLMLALVAAPGHLGAQSVEELRARREVIRDSMRASTERLEAAERAARTVPDTALVVAGITVRFPRAELPVADRRRLQRAIEDVVASLQERYGEEGAVLLEGDIWVLSAPMEPSPLGPMIAIHVETGPRASASAVSELPLQSDRIRALALSRASQRAVQRSAVIRDYVGSSLLLEDDARTHYLAYRALATSASSPARRCARGVVPDCRAILDPLAVGAWFEPGDLAPGVRPSPLGGAVRASLLKYALELGGETALRTLHTGTGTQRDPLGAVAALANVPVAELVTQWQLKVASFADQRAGVRLPLVLTSLAWGGLLLAISTRRRGQ